MADLRECKISDCDRPAHRVGLCSAHYGRKLKHGDPLLGGPLRCRVGAALRFVRTSAKAGADDCIEWPFATYDGGYGRVKWRGSTTTASFAVCELAHGAPPTVDHQAAHSCNNRKCCNPRHIRWATPVENAQDRVLHGTWDEGKMLTNFVLTEDRVKDIRRKRAAGAKVRDLACEFNVGYGTIQRLCAGETWRWVA